MNQQLTRDQLHALVWTEPMQRIAPRFGLSDVGLAKICRRAQIPLPERGYWAKAQAGKVVDLPALPPRPLGMLDQIDIGERSAGGAHREQQLASEPQPPVFPETVDEVVERARRMVGTVSVPKDLSIAHSEISKLLKRDEARRTKQNQSGYPMYWDGPVFDAPLERRRLRILNALFLTLERCGATAWVRGREARELTASVGDTPVYFSLESTTDRGRLAAHEAQPREGLRLEIQRWVNPKPPLVWTDDASVGLEDMVGEIAVQMLATGEMTLREYQQQSYESDLKQWQDSQAAFRRKQAEAERQERERLAKEKQERIDRLIGEAKAWQQAEQIRAYVHARMSSLSSIQRRDQHDLQEWAAWARRTANALDPLLDGE